MYNSFLLISFPLGANQILSLDTSLDQSFSCDMVCSAHVIVLSFKQQQKSFLATRPCLIKHALLNLADDEQTFTCISYCFLKEAPFS